MIGTHWVLHIPSADYLTLLCLPPLPFHHPDRSPRVCNTPAAAMLNELCWAGVQSNCTVTITTKHWTTYWHNQDTSSPSLWMWNLPYCTRSVYSLSKLRQCIHLRSPDFKFILDNSKNWEKLKSIFFFFFFKNSFQEASKVSFLQDKAKPMGHWLMHIQPGQLSTS